MLSYRHGNQIGDQENVGFPHWGETPGAGDGGRQRVGNAGGATVSWRAETTAAGSLGACEGESSATHYFQVALQEKRLNCYEKHVQIIVVDAVTSEIESL